MSQNGTARRVFPRPSRFVSGSVRRINRALVKIEGAHRQLGEVSEVLRVGMASKRVRGMSRVLSVIDGLRQDLGQARELVLFADWIDLARIARTSKNSLKKRNQ